MEALGEVEEVGGGLCIGVSFGIGVGIELDRKEDSMVVYMPTKMMSEAATRNAH